MKPKLFVQSIKFNDGTLLLTADKSVTLFVGPNNAGKSAALKDIYGLANPTGRMPTPHAVLTEADCSTIGSGDELVEFLKTTENFVVENRPNQYWIGNNGTSEEGVKEWWSKVMNSALPWLFTKFVSTDWRISYANKVEIMDNMNDRPQHSIHRLYFNDLFEQAGECSPSPEWIGNHLPKAKIVKSGLWQVNELEGQV